jgi:hypothetical protein
MGMLCSVYSIFNDVTTGVEMMDKLINFVVVVGVAGVTIFTLLLMNHMFELSYKEPNTKLSVQYDCRLAEISVDYPQQVKEQCRKLLMPNISYGEK